MPPREEIAGRAGLDREQIDAGRDILVEKIRLREADIDLLRAEREHGAEPQVLAAAEEISLADVHIGQRAVGGGKAEPERQLAGRLLLDIDNDDGAVRRRSRRVGDLDLLEEAEILDALLRTLHASGVERVALDEAELAADHLVQRADVAGDVDPLDVDARPFLHAKNDIDRVRLAVSGDFGLGFRRRHSRGCPSASVSTVIERSTASALYHSSGRTVSKRQHRFARQVLQRDVDVDLAEAVALAFIDREGDE